MNKPTFKELYYLYIQKLTNFPYIEKDFDALTNYELLCKVVEELNKMIDNMNTQNESILALYNAFNSLKNYIDNYFENLDVQEEINNKLDEMAEDGELTALIKNYVNPIQEEFENEINNTVNSQNERITEVEELVESAVHGSPIPVSSVDDMTDTSRLYVNTTNGYIYYYNGTAWTQGWLYQATAIGEDSILPVMMCKNLQNYYKFHSIWEYGTITNSGPSTPQTSALHYMRIRTSKLIYLEKGSVIRKTNASTKFSVQQYTTSQYNSMIQNTGWITDDEYKVTTSNFYSVIVAYTNDAEIQESDVQTLGDSCEIFKVILNYANQLSEFVAQGNPFEIKERQSNNTINLHIIHNRNFWLTFENQIEFFSLGKWNAQRKIPNKPITYDISEYGTVEVDENGGSEVELTLPNAYSLVLDTNTGIASVKYYDEIVKTDALLLRNSMGYAMSGAIVTVLDYFRLKDTETNISNLQNTISAIEENVDYDKIVKSLAHRGYMSEAPENTIPAFKMAKEKGFNYIEADVSFTADGIPVMLHDTTIDRTSNGTGNISDLTYEQLLQYDFGSWKGSQFTGTKIPTFEEFISLCKNMGVHAYPEIKNNVNTEADVKKLVDIVKKYDMIGKVSWQSTSIQYLQWAKYYDDTSRLGIVTGAITSQNVTDGISLKTNKNEVFMLCANSGLSDTNIALCRDADIRVESWLLNTKEAILGIDPYVSGVVSNIYIAGKVIYENTMN